MEKSQDVESWLWTCDPSLGVVSAMDDDTAELVTLLWTRIGIIMEDACVIALRVGSKENHAREDSLAQLAIAIETMNQLVRAARALEP